MGDREDNISSMQDASHEIEQRLRGGLVRAVEAITGDASQNPLDVFPNPADKERREDVEFGVELTADQEVAFRSAMAELGIGRESNRDAAMVGLPDGYLALLEGGQAHKMLAELNITAETAIRPRAIILAGDTERAIPEKEQEVTARVLGINREQVGATEAAVAEQILRAHPDFVPEDESVLPYGYTIDGELLDEQTGQLRRIGTIGEIPAVVMRIDREWYEDEQGERKFRRIDNFAKMKIVSQIEVGNAIGFVSSSTYQPSIEIDALRAAQETGSMIQVPTYGTAELARVKQEALPQPPALQQLAGEAYKTAQQLAKLETT